MIVLEILEPTIVIELFNNIPDAEYVPSNRVTHPKVLTWPSAYANVLYGCALSPRLLSLPFVLTYTFFNDDIVKFWTVDVEL